MNKYIYNNYVFVLKIFCAKNFRFQIRLEIFVPKKIRAKNYCFQFCFGKINSYQK